MTTYYEGCLVPRHNEFVEDLKRLLVAMDPDILPLILFTSPEERPTLDEMIPLDSIEIPDDYEESP